MSYEKRRENREDDWRFNRLGDGHAWDSDCLFGNWDNRMKHHTLYIGIDAGTHTGIAVWNRTDKRLELVETMTITKAFGIVTANVELCKSFGGEVVVFLEDARKRTWFGSSNREKLQGAGSVKRDCSIWETFCEELGVECRKIAPKHNTTKLTAAQFKVLTGWQGRTSEHSRDAACLVFGR